MGKKLLLVVISCIVLLGLGQAEYQAAETSYEEEVERQTIVKEMMNTYVDPEYHLNLSYGNSVTETQYAEIQQAALEIVEGCTTDYEKIEAITKYVSDTVYYDYYYLDGHTTDLYYSAYDVFLYRRTVCGGYANLTEVMLDSIGIPCMYLLGENHAYNAAYDSQADRWVFLDTTWCSRNKYGYNYTGGEIKWVYGGYGLNFFDWSPEGIATYPNHETYVLDGLLDSKGQVYYGLYCTGQEENWYLDLDSVVDATKSYESVVVEPDIKDFVVKNIASYSGIQGLEHTERWAGIEKFDLSKTQIETIVTWVFTKNTSLKEIILPETLTAMGGWAFWNCTSLEKVDLSNTKIETIPNTAFQGCTSLKTILAPRTLKAIEEWTFYGCSSLEKVDLSKAEELVAIEKNLFGGCSMLTEILLPDSVTYIGESAFRGCSSLEGIDLPEALETIGNYAFYGCSELAEIVLPETLTTIGEYAFWECTALKEIELPDGVTSLGNDVFGRSGLETIILPKNLTAIAAYAFFECEALREVQLSEALETIGENAFYKCVLLEEIIFPECLTSIGEYAFYDCDALIEIVIPKKVTTVDSAFLNCSSLKKIVIFNAECDLGKYPFSGIASDACIIGYEGSTAETYAKKYGKTFISIEQYGEWTKDDNGWRYVYLDNSYPANCWKQIDGKWYAFNADGYMRMGWFKEDQTWYYLSTSDGRMATSWNKINNKWYYFGTDGKMSTSWRKVGTKWYYFNTDGDMATNWKKIGTKWYFFNIDGDMQVSWKKLNNKWYYFNADGDMHVGWKSIGGIWYYFNADGDMHTGWKSIGGTWYYFNTDGDMHTGWKKLDGTWYYFDSEGAMVTGRYKINGVWNSFTSDGAWIA